MEDAISKILMKGGKEMDRALQIFQAIKNDPDGIELVDKIIDLVGRTFSLLKKRNNKGQTILHYASIKGKPSVVGYILNFINDHQGYDSLIEATDNYGESYYSHAFGNNPANIHSGGGYAMYNNKKYKICTGKRGGKYICIGVDKKKIYI